MLTYADKESRIFFVSRDITFSSFINYSPTSRLSRWERLRAWSKSVCRKTIVREKLQDLSTRCLSVTMSLRAWSRAVGPSVVSKRRAVCTLVVSKRRQLRFVPRFSTSYAHPASYSKPHTSIIVNSVIMVISFLFICASHYSSEGKETQMPYV